MSTADLNDSQNDVQWVKSPLNRFRSIFGNFTLGDSDLGTVSGLEKPVSSLGLSAVSVVSSVGIGSVVIVVSEVAIVSPLGDGEIPEGSCSLSVDGSGEAWGS